MRKNLLFLFIVSTFSMIARGQAAEIDSLIHRTNRLGLFNGNVLVADHNKVLYKTAIGFADPGSKIPLTLQHRFHIGSIAKEFNAVGIMMLKAQGKLKLEDKVSAYIPGLPAWSDSVSILHLLQYTSGLPDLNWKTVHSDADIMQDLRDRQQLLFTPGSNYLYSNNCVFLQRRIIEKITGMPFNTFVEQQLLRPCGMNAAVVDPTEKDTPIAIAFNNERQADPLILAISGWTAVTADDFYQWSNAINTFRLLSPADTRTILYPSGPNRQSGLGGGEMAEDHITRHIHDGSALRYNALLVSDPPRGRTVILLTNNKQGNLYEINTAIQAILDGKPYQQPKKPVVDLFNGKLDQLNAQQALTLYQQLKSRHAGEYNFDNESALNNLGYYYMNHNRLDDAIIIFTRNTRLFPASGNVFDSLGEAYYKKNDKKNALRYYKRALALDSTNTTARQIVTALSGE
ncbi:serine hydrolase [Chitinophaga qingshengii]|uniref:Serine hydrolase n=1 Tax=Chitinophaga qingshengii TaxID=1569794 RepID=A0ABR7THG6_9BACT|nr:serine hydrolase [Chitinophaga qingshengii]MBC9929388.1 serine hydrolase [Chitinophaga qingshengii]